MTTPVVGTVLEPRATFSPEATWLSRTSVNECDRRSFNSQRQGHPSCSFIPATWHSECRSRSLLSRRERSAAACSSLSCTSPGDTFRSRAGRIFGSASWHSSPRSFLRCIERIRWHQLSAAATRGGDVDRKEPLGARDGKGRSRSLYRTLICSQSNVDGNAEGLTTEASAYDGDGFRSKRDGLIYGPGQSGAWDGGRVDYPVVRRYLSDDVARWTMWYSGCRRKAESVDFDADQGIESFAGSLAGDGDTSAASLVTENGRTGPKTSIGIATSSNGIHWIRGEGAAETDEQGRGGIGEVLRPNADWWTFDRCEILVSDVEIMSSRVVRAESGLYWMFYAGANGEKVAVDARLAARAVRCPSASSPASSALSNGNDDEHGKTAMAMEISRTRPGLAMSQDGRNWARIEGDHHSGALFDVGSDGEWDSTFIGPPCMVFHGPGDLRMYYHSLDLQTGFLTIGLARSRDGIRWIKQGKIMAGGKEGSFDELGVASPKVIADSPNGYIMIYEGVSVDGTHSIGMARSKDGLWEWERCGTGPILAPSTVEDAWDNEGVRSPCLVQMEGTWRLYYVGDGRDGRSAIGMAEAVDNNLQSFRRWKSLSDPSHPDPSFPFSVVEAP